MEEIGFQMVHVNETRLIGIIFCSYLAFSTLKNMHCMHKWYESHHMVVKPDAFLGIGLFAVKLPPRLLPLMMCGFALSLLAYAYTADRLYGLLALLIYLWVFSNLTEFHLIHQKSSNCPIVLSILLLSEENHSVLFYLQDVGVENEIEWSVVFIRIFLSMAYLETGIVKMIVAGWKWTKGKALQWHLLEHYLWGGFRYSIPLMQNIRILRIVSTITVLMQLTAPIIVLGGWFPFAHGVVAIGFHLSTQVFMGIYFLTFFGPAVVSSALSYPIATLLENYISVDYVTQNIGSVGPTLEHSTGFQILLMAIIPGFQLYCSLSSSWKFPFAPYRLFSGDFSDYKDFGVLLLEFEDENGEFEPWKPLTYYDLRDLGGLTDYNASDNLCNMSLEDRRCLTTLSPKFYKIFEKKYWPSIREEYSNSANSICSIRLNLRYPIWEGGSPIGYEDYVIGRIPIINGMPCNVELITRSHIRSHRF